MKQGIEKASAIMDEEVVNAACVETEIIIIIRLLSPSQAILPEQGNA